MYTYALLDSGSQASLVLEKFANEVALEGPREVLTLRIINCKEECKPSRKVWFVVKATSDNATSSLLIPEAWTVPQLNQPKQTVTRSLMQTWPHTMDLDVPEVYSKDVTVLLGANVACNEKSDQSEQRKYQMEWGKM